MELQILLLKQCTYALILNFLREVKSFEKRGDKVHKSVSSRLVRTFTPLGFAPLKPQQSSKSQPLWRTFSDFLLLLALSGICTGKNVDFFKSVIHPALRTSLSHEDKWISVNISEQLPRKYMAWYTGQATPRDGGFQLSSGQEVVMDVPEKWSGRIWVRQNCCFDENGKGSCDTGDCGGQLHCPGMVGAPPATVVEMTLGTLASPLHFYDVSLVDGFNLPVSMKPVGGGIGCGVAECEVDLNICCPSALEVKIGGKVMGCKSACLDMQSAKYCCSGEYANPKTCKPTLFAHLFKAICPKAYSYAFDDSSSLNGCRASRYVITFCPPK